MNNTSDDYLNCRGNMSNASMILFVILNFFSGLAAFSGNTLVLAAVYYLRGHRKTSHYFLASLAVADLSVGVIMNPVLASKAVLSIWQGEHWLSKTADFMWLQTTTATALSLCAVSYDRYAAIRGVFSYQSLLTRPRAILIILTIWLFSILIGTSRLFIRNPNAHSVLWISSTLLTVIIPLLLIAYCYTKIYTAAKIQRQKIAENSLTRKQTRNSLKNKKAAYTVGM
ncbi:predicted protein [Nematostella vectensis]|uniref:G-protein coupled receptors family 1 profile domain-containing protein n=1 Tax=Nematostella vectensis TaxID=45351 RepID=A7RYK9_NEMVE|nr:predicted protein [Nematostella vectensis]|eukprot:XP_001635543.1 predicted protein [Nematostella vectensis]